jgi:hypothetical protein
MVMLILVYNDNGDNDNAGNKSGGNDNGDKKIRNMLGVETSQCS